MDNILSLTNTVLYMKNYKYNIYMHWTHLNHFSNVLGNFRSWTQVKEATTKAHCHFIILHFESQIDSCSKGKDLVPGLQLAVSEVRCQLKGTRLLFRGRLAQTFAVELHADAHHILLTDSQQVLCLTYLTQVR